MSDRVDVVLSSLRMVRPEDSILWPNVWRPTDVTPEVLSMIHDFQPDAPGTPHGFAPIVSQAQKDYFKREMQREMDEFEFGVLQKLMVELRGANKMLRKKGRIDLIRREGDLIQVFVDRVRIHEAEAAMRKIMVGYTGGRRDAS